MKFAGRLSLANSHATAANGKGARMNTKAAKEVIEVAGFTFQKNPCGIGWQCVDNKDGSLIAEHGQLGTLIQKVADQLGL